MLEVDTCFSRHQLHRSGVAKASVVLGTCLARFTLERASRSATGEIKARRSFAGSLSLSQCIQRTAVEHCVNFRSYQGCSTRLSVLRPPLQRQDVVHSWTESLPRSLER